jgi:hypothetical protein
VVVLFLQLHHLGTAKRSAVHRKNGDLSNSCSNALWCRKTLTKINVGEPMRTAATPIAVPKTGDLFRVFIPQ